VETVALVFAVLAFLVVLKQRGEISLLKDRLQRLADAGGASEGRAQEALEADLRTNRAFIARLAAGAALDPEQVREGRLWSDVGQARALELLAAGVRVLDVRTPRETRAGIVPGALCIPVAELPQRCAELGSKSVPTLVYCAAGVRSVAACQFLSEEGFSALHNLEAGFSSWSGPSEVPAGPGN